MARHEGHHPEGHKEHPRARGRVMKERKRGGGVGEGEMEREKEEAEEGDEHKRARGGHVPHHKARKSGGHVAGKKAAGRPDRRRASGGATSDEHPMSSAGKMTTLPYEAHSDAVSHDMGGRGKDRD